MSTAPASNLPSTHDRILFRGALAADLHAIDLRTACEAVGRDLAVLAPAIVRELRAYPRGATTAERHAREDLAQRVLRWESHCTAVDLAKLVSLAGPVSA